MKKTVCIKPVHPSMETRVESVKILNEFKNRGFDTLSQFRNIVVQYYPEFKGYKEVMALDHFWRIRNFDEFLNEKLNNVIEKLKSE